MNPSESETAMPLDPTLPIGKCLWCGVALGKRPRGHREHRFCGKTCKTAYHNLRRSRGGGEIYDLILARVSSYKNRYLITDIDQIARRWREEDKARMAKGGVTT